MTPTKEDFLYELHCQMLKKHHSGESELIASAGEIHRKVGGYPGPDHRMPVCCSAMKSEMQQGDRIVDEPLSGQGARLTIKYRLPNRTIRLATILAGAG